MQIFHIRYRNTQGTLMRILGAASRRGIDLPYVQAEPAEQSHQITLLMDVNPKQVGQLCRDWRAIVDVMDVGPGALNRKMPARSILTPVATKGILQVESEQDLPNTRQNPPSQTGSVLPA